MQHTRIPISHTSCFMLHLHALLPITQSPMPPTLFFIRHGQTSSNLHGVKQGIEIDDYLNTEGILQTEHLRQLVEFLNLDMIFTSYLHRAEETAAILDKQQRPIPVLHDYRLRERDFGSLSGKTAEQIEALVPDWKNMETMQMYDYRPYGGESVDDVRQRLFGAILDISNNYPDKNVGIISHGGPIRLLLFHFPQIVRLYHAQDAAAHEVSNIGNTDIYQSEISEGKMANLKSLLK